VRREHALLFPMLVFATMSSGAMSPDRRFEEPEGSLAPRLEAPAPPDFDVSGDARHITVRWLGRIVTIRTSMVGGEGLQWQRKITKHSTHFEVADEISNPGPDAIGAKIRHEITSHSSFIRLGGRRSGESLQLYDPWNPTLFVPFAEAGLGIVAEDDVFRQQLTLAFSASRGIAGLGTDMFCIANGDRYTLAWSVYPLATDSYWDFISTVRRDWGVNRTITGSFVWFNPRDVLSLPEENLRAALLRQNVNVASMWGGWVDRERTESPPLIGFGTYVLADVYAGLRDSLRQAIQRLHAVRAGIKVLVYFDARRDSSPNAPDLYPDSLATDEHGKPLVTSWNGQFSKTWTMAPTVANTFGKALRAVIERAKSLGADGIYWDEMTTASYGGPEITFDRWDRRSCTLAHDGEIRKRVGVTNLLSDAVNMSYAEAAGMLLGNSPPTTRGFQQRPDLRMVEAQHNGEWGSFAHLTTPIGFIGSRTDWDTVLEKLGEGVLTATSGLANPSDISARMYPITPDYIQSGTIHGEERIITIQSGAHGWRNGGEVKAFRYDRSGTEHPADWRIRRERGAVLVDVQLGPREAAVIERLP
jgi:hypothetical protein